MVNIARNSYKFFFTGLLRRYTPRNDCFKVIDPLKVTSEKNASFSWQSIYNTKNFVIKFFVFII